ncbi:major royal jelly family protein [Pendulispora rubella]|uniref:Major royal jelly family protein n=1 Tax=Pendulispora rubella TaxID=2741070 RepID=A0ABZ2L6T6_9BACT
MSIRSIAPASFAAFAALACTPRDTGSPASQTDASPILETVAESDTMIWNAVAVESARTFAAGPRWTGSKGPSVAEITGQHSLTPYPDAAWNAWAAGASPERAFVNVNALHGDGHGGLWAIDTGAPDFGGNPLPGGAKVVHIEAKTNRVVRVYTFDARVALPGSYIDDIRFHGEHAYLTDAGRAGIIVLDLARGDARRVLDDAPAVTAPADRPIVLGGETVKAPDGSPLRVHADPLETSPDGKYLYFAPLSGPWSRIETRWLDDPNIAGAEIAQHVEPWADLPPVGGTVMDSQGSLYFTDLAASAVKRRAPDGSITTIVQDARLHWVDAPVLDAEGFLLLPTPQMDRMPLFNGGQNKVSLPVAIYRVPSAGRHSSH